MSIDTGSSVGYNALFPVAGVNQPSKTFRDNFAIIKQAIEKLQSASSDGTGPFSVSTSQASDGRIGLIVTLNNNMFNLPIGNPSVAATLGAIRYNGGAVQYYNGTAWVSLSSQDGASVRTALGYDPANIASPAFTGTPTAPTASLGTNSTQLATTAFVRAQIADLIGSVPSTLDTLAELSSALGNDPDFAAHLTTQLAGKSSIGHTHANYLETITATSGTHTGNSLSVVGSNGLTTSISGDVLTIALNSSLAHGNLGGGALHALAIANGAAGFMSGSDKAKLDSFTGTGNTFSRFIIQNSQGMNVRDAAQANDSFVFTADSPIVLDTTGNQLHLSFAPTDASHGLRGGSNLHAIAAPNGNAGFMSGADKYKLDQLTAALATTSTKGYLSPQDKTKLDGLVLQTGGGYTTLNINGKVVQVPGDSQLKFSGVNGIDLDYISGNNTLYFVLNRIGNIPVTDYLTVLLNYNASNDRNASTITPPIVATDGTAVDHTVLSNASVNISFEWTWPGPSNLFTDTDEDGNVNIPSEDSIDGFQIYVYQSSTASTYTLGTNPSEEFVTTVPAQKRSIVLYGVAPEKYYSFFVRAFRKVAGDVAPNGVIVSSTTGCTGTGENPYRPMANVAFAGDVTGTLQGVAATTVVANATGSWAKFSGAGNTLPAGNVEFNFAASGSKGGNASNTDAVGTQSAATVQSSVVNFNSRNDRLSTAVLNPTILNDGTAVDHTLNADSTANISFEWGWSGDNATIDGFIVTIYQGSSATPYVIGTSAADEMVYYFTPEKRAMLLYGVPATKYYTFYVQAYRIVDNDVSASGFIRSSSVKSTASDENPYQPSTTTAYSGNITGTINGVSAAIVQANAQGAWGKFSGTGNTLPAGNVEFNFATSDTRGGNALNTNFVGSQSAATVQSSVINFNSRNDRNAASVVLPVVATDGTAVDHVVNTDGSVDISFEWSWPGTAGDIDGFILTVYQSASLNTAYTYGTYVTEESVFYVTPEKRAAFLYGVAANKYYTFFIEAYRVVDNDISASGFLRSGPVKSTRSEENPYRPSATVAFGGDVTGTINNVPAATVQSNAQSAWGRFSGAGNTLPSGNVEFTFATSSTKGGNALNTDAVGTQPASTVQATVVNFNARNDRNGAAIVAPVVPSDGTAVDHTLNANGSCNISFEWTWGGSVADIDGFIVYVYATNSTAQYTLGTDSSAEFVQYLTPDRRAFVMYGVSPELYYTFYVQAYRIVDTDINSNSVIKSTAVKSSRGEENPYRPAVSPVFAGDITGTIGGTNVNTVLSNIGTLQAQVSTIDSGSAAYSIVRNPLFSDYPNATIPTYWTDDTYGTITRVTGTISTYSARIVGGAGTVAYMSQISGSSGSPNIRTNQWMVIEASVRLISGSLSGSGVMLRTIDSSGGLNDSLNIQFANDRDSTDSIVGAGVAGNTYTFTKLVQITQANAKYVQFYIWGHNGAYGSITQANTIDFLRVSARPAQQGEIEVRTATTTVDALTSTVSTYSGAISDLNGKTSAYLTLGVSSGTFAEAFVKIQSTTSPGVTTSSLALGAQEIHLYNTGTGGYRRTLSIVNGNAEFTGGLSAGTYIRLGNGVQWNVALQARDFAVTDGQVVNFGTDLNNIPSLNWQYNNLAPLGTGETYNVYAENLTSTGFTARLKKRVPQSPTYYSLTVDSAPGTGPTRQIDKASNPDASDGFYRMTINGTITDTPQPNYDTDPYCIWIFSYLHSGQQAMNAVVGDQLTVLNNSYSGYEVGSIKNITQASQLCVKITTASGIELTVSESTPITLQSGEVINVLNSLHEDVAVLDNGDFRWEEIVSLENMGELPVAFIDAGDKTYAAGNNADRMIFTHNLMQYKYFERPTNL